MKKYYDNREDNIAFERCIDVMARLMIKHGPAFIERMEKIRQLYTINIELFDGRTTTICRYEAYRKAASSGQEMQAA